MEKIVAFLAFFLAPSLVFAQFSVPLRFKNSGTLVTPTRPFANCKGGITCVDDPALNATDIDGSGIASSVTLQTAYNNSAGASPSIALTGPGGAVSVGSGANTWFSVDDAGTNLLDSAGALNLGATNATSIMLSNGNDVYLNGALKAALDHNTALDFPVYSGGRGWRFSASPGNTVTDKALTIYTGTATTKVLALEQPLGTEMFSWDGSRNMNYGGSATLTASVAAATVAGSTWTHTGGTGGVASGGAAGGIGGAISLTAGTGGDAIAGAGNTAAVGGAFTAQAGTGGAAAGANNAANGAIASLIGGAGGTAAGGLVNGAGGAVTITGGTAGGGAGTGANGGAVTLNGGAKSGAATDGAINIGVTTASAVNVGNGTIITKIVGREVVNAQNAGAGANTDQIVPSMHNSGTVNQAIEYGTKQFAAATSATVTFAPAFLNAPQCTCIDQTNIIALKCVATATTLTLTTAGSNSDTYAYICMGDR